MATIIDSIGSSLDDSLAEEGLLEPSQSYAIKQVLAWQIAQFIEQQKLTKATRSYSYAGAVTWVHGKIRDGKL